MSFTDVFSVAGQWRKYGNGLYLTFASLIAWLTIAAAASRATPVAVLHRAAVVLGWSPVAQVTGSEAPPLFQGSSQALAVVALVLVAVSMIWLATAPAVRALRGALSAPGFTWSDHMNIELNCQVWGRLSASVWILLLIALQAGWSPTDSPRWSNEWISTVNRSFWGIIIACVGYLVVWAVVESYSDRLVLGSLFRFGIRILPRIVKYLGLALLVSAFSVAIIALFVPLTVFSWVCQRESQQAVEQMQKLQELRAPDSVAQGARVAPPAT